MQSTCAVNWSGPVTPLPNLRTSAVLRQWIYRSATLLFLSLSLHHVTSPPPPIYKGHKQSPVTSLFKDMSRPCSRICHILVQGYVTSLFKDMVRRCVHILNVYETIHKIEGYKCYGQTPNIAVGWVKILLHIWEALGYSVGHEARYPHCDNVCSHQCIHANTGITTTGSLFFFFFNSRIRPLACSGFYEFHLLRGLSGAHSPVPSASFKMQHSQPSLHSMPYKLYWRENVVK
jgi:hypothetical protein